MNESQSRPAPNMKLVVVLLLLATVLMYLLRDVLIPVAFSFLLAYFLDPVVDRLEERKFSRTLGIVLLLAAAMLVFAVFLLIFIPLIVDETESFIARLPEIISNLEKRLVPLLTQWTGMELPSLLEKVGLRAKDWLHNLTAAELAPVTTFLKNTFTSTFGAIMALFSAAMIPIFTFYFLRDFDTLKLYPLHYVPLRHKNWVIDLFREIDEVLSSFVRGQVTVCLILGMLYAVGFAISGVPLGFLIGLIAGMVAFIPYLGSAVGVGLSLLLALLDWQGYGPLIGIGITFTIVQTLESFVITPKVVGDKVGLSPLAVILALMIGGELLGFAGILIAVPVASVINILWRRMRDYYQNTRFYLDSETSEELEEATERMEDSNSQETEETIAP